MSSPAGDGAVVAARGLAGWAGIWERSALTTESTRQSQGDAALGPLAQRAFPDVAQALRSAVGAILASWEREVRRVVPSARGADVAVVADGLPDILSKMADALASGDPAEVGRLMERSPHQGIHRFGLHYNVRDLATEDRLLRLVALDHVEHALTRRLGRDEDAALNWAIDLMAQQAMVAFVEHQNARLRDAAEAELKYLSFLSHDLNNNLNGVTLSLQVLAGDLRHAGGFAEAVESVELAQQAIDSTVAGMRRLLDHERLRHADRPTFAPVDLHALASRVAGQFSREARQKGMTVAVEVPPDTAVESDAAMIALVVENLVGNAVKYAGRGTVQIGCDDDAGGLRLSVADEGPGIAPEKLGLIFDAFRRGEMHGQGGVGLGLAIASRAARTLNAELTVDSKVGVGSTFRLTFPRREGGGPPSATA